MSLIEIKKLTYSYPTKKDSIKNITLNIEEGTFNCIVGENGSGKTTLIKCIVGLIKDYKGEVILNEKVGYLPQKTTVQSNFPASVEEVVLSGTIPHNLNGIFYSRNDKLSARNSMIQLGVYDIRKKCFADLSGGQQQRVLIARALSATDKIIILDEPTNGLDPKVAKQIYELLKKLQQKYKLTILMVSHDVERALKFADRVIEIKEGQLSYDGVPSNYQVEGDK